VIIVSLNKGRVRALPQQAVSSLELQQQVGVEAEQNEIFASLDNLSLGEGSEILGFGRYHGKLPLYASDVALDLPPVQSIIEVETAQFEEETQLLS
jgi:hypothetical protein